MKKKPRSAHPPMKEVAMPLDQLDRWLAGRSDQGAMAANIHMLDGYVTAIVVGPESISPPDWICPLLGIDADAFNHGGTPEFAAISAVAVRTTRSATRSRRRQIGLLPSIGTNPMATSMRDHGVGGSMPR